MSPLLLQPCMSFLYQRLVIDEYGELVDDNWGGKAEVLEKDLFSVTLFTPGLTCTMSRMSQRTTNDYILRCVTDCTKNF